MSDWIIQSDQLTKYYGQVLAVDGLNLGIESGCFYGLLGPNGAGKTTTLKMLSMLLNPTKGKVEIDGQDINRSATAVKSCIGVVPQHFSLQREMSVEETLKLHGMLHKMKKDRIKERMDLLLNFAQMHDHRKKLVSELSGGNKRKLMIIRAMMHEPKILFLDEPTVGLDASIRRTIWDLLKRLKSEGLTMVLTTHYIEEASVLCDRIGMMTHGRLQMENSPQGFLTSMAPYTVEVFDGDQTIYYQCASREEASQLTKDSNGDVLVRRTNLEDVYVKLTKERVALG